MYEKKEYNNHIGYNKKNKKNKNKLKINEFNISDPEIGNISISKNYSIEETLDSKNLNANGIDINTLKSIRISQTFGNKELNPQILLDRMAGIKSSFQNINQDLFNNANNEMKSDNPFFGSPLNIQNTGSLLFGAPKVNNVNNTLFNFSKNENKGTPLFDQNKTENKYNYSLFGNNTPENKTTPLFMNGASLFGNKENGKTENKNISIFGSANANNERNSLFGIKCEENKNTPLFFSEGEEKKDGFKNLFGNVIIEEKEKEKDSISLFGQKNEKKDENKSILFGSLDNNLFNKLSASLGNNNDKSSNFLIIDENKKIHKSIFDSTNSFDNDKNGEEKIISDNKRLFTEEIPLKISQSNLSLFSFNDKNDKNKSDKPANKEEKENEMPLKNNLIYIREYSNEDQNKIKVYKFESNSPENLVNIEEAIFHHLENNYEKKKDIYQQQSKEDEKKLDDKNIKINCAIIEPEKMSFTIDIDSSSDISLLKQSICVQLNKSDKYNNSLNANSFCIMKNYIYVCKYNI